jgi:hypothetical protein
MAEQIWPDDSRGRKQQSRRPGRVVIDHDVGRDQARGLRQRLAGTGVAGESREGAFAAGTRVPAAGLSRAG